MEIDDHIGETISEHAKRLLLPSLVSLSDTYRCNVSHYTSSLISDAMHLRNVYSHRWNPLALRFYRIRNTHGYRSFAFFVVAAHTASLIFDAPRGEWDKVISRVRLSDEATQKYACALVNTIGLVIYIIDIAVQCTFVKLCWRDVDWAGEVRGREERSDDALRIFTTTHPCITLRGHIVAPTSWQLLLCSNSLFCRCC